MTADEAGPQRWTVATVYADMWVDPDDDPRDTGVSPVGERDTLTQYLTAYRHTLRMKCDGLSAEQLASRSVPPSTMSLLGLVRHLAEVERSWTRARCSVRLLRGCTARAATPTATSAAPSATPTWSPSLIEEYARHCGHADLLRERIDGRVGQ